MILSGIKNYYFHMPSFDTLRYAQHSGRTEKIILIIIYKTYLTIFEKSTGPSVSINNYFNKKIKLQHVEYVG